MGRQIENTKIFGCVERQIDTNMDRQINKWTERQINRQIGLYVSPPFCEVNNFLG